VIALATKFCEETGWTNYGYVFDLGAVYASTGDYASAVTWITKARDLAPASSKAVYEQYLSNYRGAAEAVKKP
jgi:hypothetical protein